MQGELGIFRWRLFPFRQRRGPLRFLRAAFPHGEAIGNHFIEGEKGIGHCDGLRVVERDFAQNLGFGQLLTDAPARSAQSLATPHRQSSFDAPSPITVRLDPAAAWQRN